MTQIATAPKQGFIEKLNGPWHERALWIYLAIVILHWTEHLFQAAQIWILGMPRPQALGALGYVFPWLVKSEVMHFTYALLMFGGLVLLRPGFRGKAKTWWTASLVIQGWHLFEHSLLLIQATVGQNLFGSPVPTSVLQQFVPRPELHLFYNLIVFIPMVVAVWLHTRPDQADVNECSCANAPVRMEQAGLTGSLTEVPNPHRPGRAAIGCVYTSPMVGQVRDAAASDAPWQPDDEPAVGGRAAPMADP